MGEWGWGSGLLLPDSVSSELTDALCCSLGATVQNDTNVKISASSRIDVLLKHSLVVSAHFLHLVFGDNRRTR